MIKFNYTLCPSLIIDIKNQFINNYMQVKALEVLAICKTESPEWYPALHKHLQYKSLIKIVFAKANSILKIKEEFTKDLSLISERYNPEVFFKKLIIDDSLVNINIQSTKNKQAILEYKNVMIVELTRLERIEKSYCASHFRNRLILASTASLVKKELKYIQKLKKGFPKEVKLIIDSLFPSWVSQFSDIFNYDLFSSKFGYDIVTSSGLLVCPFCNEEKINIVRGRTKNHRPALDHFYAKSKYPYLAVTLYNLIPIGGRCNTSFKSDIDMFDGYMNPLLTGVNDHQVFDFTYNVMDNSVNFKIKENDDFILNQMLFELDSVYDTEEYKKLYLDFRYSFTYHKGLGVEPPFYEDMKLMDSTFNISKNKNYHTWQAKKFETDALEDIFRDL
ncbi:Uncharacterised protein [Enterobacter hormaechei]|uniref:hypothetical protein n=1 Tax=Enterobacteriaceae TaxID=543 RepID=UPI000668FB0C|nr:MULTISPECIES: hypothetical protein [Enterobacteriaceae]MBC5380263.1 hypothetical protein [Klebsiella variicola]VEB12617.1 Uncharacterised protein [Enterobacter hormaechei]HCR0361951.1 hypothetical protein [Klebsiella aerogenes]HDU4305778.1 hypothetical protein [Klebsiella aerogenes]